MGYALRISDVDFSSVAVDQVNYIIPVPCSSISLDESTLSFTFAEESKTLTATKVPSNTTDTLTWSSSNENVATVSNGVVTIHGIGTATITATCGEATATASITQTTIRAAGEIKTLADKVIQAGIQSGSSWLFTAVTAAGNFAVANAYDDTDNARVIYGADNDCELVLVPYGATKIKIATENGTSITFNYMYIADAENLVTHNNVDYPPSVDQKTFVNSSTGADVEYGQAVCFRATTSTLADTPTYFYFE